MSRERAARRATAALGAFALALPAVALAGGMSVGRSVQNAFSGELNDSFPQSRFLWAVSVQFTGSGTQTLDTYAICSEGARSREVAERPLAANKDVTSFAICG